MAELLHVSLVRCPKCACFLPEHADYSLYKCGGCGAVLQAGGKSRCGDGLAISSDRNDVLIRWNESKNDDAVNFQCSSDVEIKSVAESDLWKAGATKTIDVDSVAEMKLLGEDTNQKSVVHNEDDDSAAGIGYCSEPIRSGRMSSSQPRVRYSTFGEDNGDRNEPDGGGDLFVADDRAELLRKLEELKEQMRRSSLAPELPSISRREFPPMHFHGAPSYSGCRLHPRYSDPVGRHVFFRDSSPSPGHYAPKAFHPTLCSCYHCRNNHPVVPNSVHPIIADSRSSVPPRRWPSGSSALNRKVAMAVRGKYHHPVAGGAPYIICSKCFEVLKIPEKAPQAIEMRMKIRCGSCCTLINFFAANNTLKLSTNEEEEPRLAVEDDAKNSFNDSEDSSQKFQENDWERLESSIELSLNQRKAKDTQRLSSSSSSLLGNSDPSFAGSPSSKNGNRSSRTDTEKMKAAAPPQNFVKEACSATETEVSYNEISSTGVSQNAVSNEEDASKKSSRGESFFASLLMKNKNSVDGNKPTVSVNGHVVPARQVRKAEKLAGPVQPGNYWYDSHAGFWGVMGGHCLGMIPPCIKEFSYPMEEKCSGGDTAVFVNGRELHRKDLDLLASRGLPKEGDKSYIVQASGKVVDEDTGEVLDSLGKLAPTIEKRKRGFGMKPPKVAATSD